MRPLLVLLCALGLPAAEPVPWQMPVQGGDRALVVHALSALERGETGPLDALPLRCLEQPPALADGEDPACERRWSLALPQALARAPEARRPDLLAAIDRLYQRGRASLGAAAAIDALPAPAARAELARQADRAFDRGRFRDAIACWELLAANGSPAPAPRFQLAGLLDGHGPEVAPELLLPAPGPSVPCPPPVLAGSGAWLQAPGWIARSDPWRRPLWQRRIPRSARLTVGERVVLLRSEEGALTLAADGRSRPLPPLPETARACGLGADAAWFAIDGGEEARTRGQPQPTAVWRWPLQAGPSAAVLLPDRPLGAPVLRGRSSLWLTRRELLLLDGLRLAARFRHGLPAGEGWSLASDRDGPLVLGDGDRAWRIRRLDRALTEGPRAPLLLRAGRAAELDAASAGLEGLLALGPERVLAAGELPWSLARDAQQRAWIWEILGRPPALRDRVGPGAWAGYDGEPDPAAWDWRCRVELAGPPPCPPATAARLAADPVPWKLASAQRDAAGVWRREDRSYVIHRSATAIELRCEDAAGPAWSRRWQSLPLLAAPSLACCLRPDALIVVEGARQVTALRPSDGILLGWGVLPEADPGLLRPIAGGFVQLLPTGLNTHLALARRGDRSLFALPAPGRWCAAWGERVLVACSDGSARLYPGGQVLDLPAGLATAPDALALPEGLWSDDRLWRWE